MAKFLPLNERNSYFQLLNINSFVTNIFIGRHFSAFMSIYLEILSNTITKLNSFNFLSSLWFMEMLSFYGPSSNLRELVLCIMQRRKLVKWRLTTAYYTCNFSDLVSRILSWIPICFKVEQVGGFLFKKKKIKQQCWPFIFSLLNFLLTFFFSLTGNSTRHSGKPNCLKRPLWFLPLLWS